MAYEFILKKMYGSKKLWECLIFNLNEMNLMEDKYQLQMRALIHDYNSLLIEIPKEIDQFNGETTEISSRLLFSCGS